jgi:prepilin-type N-terminal cleavage/methylation domain-containing protein
MSERGFTLVEVVVALALAAGLMILVSAALGLGFTGLERLDAAADRIARRGHADAVLRRQIAAAYPAADARSSDSSFSGRPDALVFTALDGASGPGLYRVWVTVERGGTLVLARHALGTVPPAPIERAVLADGVADFRLAYFGAATPGETPAWHESWENRRTLPALVSVRFDLAAEGGRQWPAAVIRVWAAEAGP